MILTDSMIITLHTAIGYIITFSLGIVFGLMIAYAFGKR